MGFQNPSRSQAGFSLVETLLVLAVLAVCLAVGGISLARGFGLAEARGVAATWQTAAPVAQVGAVWSGEDGEIRLESGLLTVRAGLDPVGGIVGYPLPSVPVIANVARWQRSAGAAVRFLGTSAHPDSAGSLYFRTFAGEYRVTVRLESGLTTRTRLEPAQ
jgi:prepilin-type N-terminal cleavage/methylation domain-containing protein